MIEDGSDVPRLLLVVAHPDRHSEIEPALVALAGSEEVRSPAAGAFVVHATVTPAALRDALRSPAGSDGVLLIVEFERWSSLGDAVDPAWLLRRGH